MKTAATRARDVTSKWKSKTVGWIYLAIVPTVFFVGLWLGHHGPVVVEVETDRLVCGVVSNRLGTSRGVSCVPKIPGLFDERMER